MILINGFAILLAVVVGCTKTPQSSHNQQRKEYFGAWVGAEDDYFAIKIVKVDSLTLKMYVLDALLENINPEDCEPANPVKTFKKLSATPIPIDSVAIKNDSLYLRTSWFYVGANNKSRILYQAKTSDSTLSGEMRVDWYVDAVKQNFPEIKQVQLQLMQ